MSVVLALVPVALVTGAIVASASTADGVAASNMQFPIGPVGIAAVVVGLGGLVTGLVRHHRRIAAAAVLATPRAAVIEPEPVDKAAA
ncbi:hypothetical protein [Actinophytocola glycyrrhizae]|uniref:Secreted protein with PEP-CTERM sorting signal n=1 Tax=Actinophytocola glycyrrhizae TaxID=2044873 RepID=A0ABV9RXL5_9PSEU